MNLFELNFSSIFSYRDPTGTGSEGSEVCRQVCRPICVIVYGVIVAQSSAVWEVRYDQGIGERKVYRVSE